MITLACSVLSGLGNINGYALRSSTHPAPVPALRLFSALSGLDFASLSIHRLRRLKRLAHIHRRYRASDKNVYPCRVPRTPPIPAPASPRPFGPRWHPILCASPSPPTAAHIPRPRRDTAHAPSRRYAPREHGLRHASRHSRATAIQKPHGFFLDGYPASSSTSGVSRPLRSHRPYRASGQGTRHALSPYSHGQRLSRWPGPSRCLHPFGAIAPRGRHRAVPTAVPAYARPSQNRAIRATGTSSQRLCCPSVLPRSCFGLHSFERASIAGNQACNRSNSVPRSEPHWPRSRQADQAPVSVNSTGHLIHQPFRGEGDRRRDAGIP